MEKESNHQSSDYILYIGSYLNRKVVEQRGLPTFNVAGSNRMHRLANALHSVNQKVIIISPAASLRMQWTGNLFYKASISKTGQSPVFFCPAFGLPIINSLLESITLLWSLVVLSGRVNAKAAIIYNFNPALVIITLFLKYILKIPVFNNIEDISKPKLADWKKMTEVRPLQQIIFAICMNIISRSSDGLIIPSKRFLEDLPKNKNTIAVSGCMPLSGLPHTFPEVQFPIKVLFSGKIEFEHGIHFFLGALEALQKDVDFRFEDNLMINICGSGSKADWLTQKLESLPHLPINYLGFVSTETYQNLLQSADVCVALQNPQGRYGNYKTPSKVYEYLGFGKLVVATPVGDLPDLPSSVIELCKSDIQQSLQQILKKLIAHPELISQRRGFVADYAQKNFSYSKNGMILKAFLQGK